MTDKDKYIIARWMYSIGEDFISDAEYSSLERLIKVSGECSDYLERSWSLDPCPIEVLENNGMSDFIRDVKVGYVAESIPSLVTIEEVERQLRGLFGKATLSYKMDGFNIQLKYINGTLREVKTRGRSSDALDISQLKPYLPQEIALRANTIIIGEAQLTYENFERLKVLTNKDLISIRSSVRSALATNPELVTFSAFDIQTEGYELDAWQVFNTLQALGFNTSPWVKITNFNELLSYIDIFSQNDTPNGLETDGLVYKSEDCGEVWAIRIGAWQSPYYEAIIKGYEESFGPHKIGMKLVIFPVNTGKSVQQKINITNLAQIVKNELFVGTPIVFKKISDAIADIDIRMTLDLRKRLSYVDDYEEAIKEIIERGR